MKFYSYDYVLSQISQQNWIMVIVSLCLICITGFFAFKAYKDKREGKFRELSIISILSQEGRCLRQYFSDYGWSYY